MKEVVRREKEEGITPDPDVDAYMKVNKKKYSLLFLFYYLLAADEQ
jgi:hypothetical protein